MSKIPISIQKIKIERNYLSGINNEKSTNEDVQYLFKLVEKNELWNRTYLCSREDLLKLRNEIDELIKNTTTAEILNVSDENGKIIDEHYKSDKLCENCSFKLKSKCVECLFILQSPLERKLFLELSKNYINFKTQYGLNWNGENIITKGKTYENKDNNFKEVLTIVDFYIEKREKKICVYTDGHTYHERTEEQARKDRNIDRKLQELGFQVLRYTGKEVNENISKIILEIENWIK